MPNRKEAMSEYADQRAHDVMWMTAEERNALDSTLPLDDGRIVRLLIESKRMGKIVWPYAAEALEALGRIENLAVRADERRIMCDEKDETIKRLRKRIRELEDQYVWGDPDPADPEAPRA